MYNRTKIWAAAAATFLFSALLIAGAVLSSFPAGVQITDQPFEAPGFLVDGRTLYLGSSHRGSDLLSDLVSGTWFGIWICGVSSILSIAIAWPIRRAVLSRLRIVRVAAVVSIRTVCALSIVSLFMLLAVTGNYYEHAPAPLILLLTLYALPFGVLFFVALSKSDFSFGYGVRSLSVYALRRWAAVHMLFAALGFLFWLRSEWPGSLIGIARSHATLIAFGDWTPALPVLIHISVALCLRLWAEILEECWTLPPSPLSDCWVFLPSFLENELAEHQSRPAGSAVIAKSSAPRPPV